MDSFLSAEKVTDSWAVGIWCCTGSARFLGNCNRKIEMDGELFLFLLGIAVLVVALFQKMRRYVCTPYRNIPVLNQILSKKQLEQLLDGEHFEPIEFEDDAMKKYLEIYRSKNWMLIGGKLISKKLALWVTVDRSKNDTLLKIIYLNGTTAKARVDLEIREKDMKNLLLC